MPALSETFWLAVLAVVGTLVASIVPAHMQRSFDLRKFTAELYLKYKIEALQQLHVTLYDFLDVVGVDSPDFLQATSEELEAYRATLQPVFAKYTRTFILAHVYLQPFTHKALQTANKQYGQVTFSLLDALSTPSDIAQLTKLAEEHKNLHSLLLRAYTAVALELNPPVLKDLEKLK